MKKVLKKLLVTSIVLIMCLFSSLPIVQATYNNITDMNNISDSVEEENIVDQNLTESKLIDDKTTYNNFDIVLSGILSQGDEQDITLEDVETIISNKPEHNGIWIEGESRNFILNLINSLTNKIYKIDDDGFLIEDTNSSKSSTSEKLNFYTEKIDEIISGDKLILVSIADTYKNFNEEDQSIIDIGLEDEEYALLFKENENNEEDHTNIIILNSEIYSEDNTEETVAFLLNKILEVYYNEDEDFKAIASDTEFIDNSGIYSDFVNKEEITVDENANVIGDNNEVTNNIENENNVITEDSTMNITKTEPSNLFDDSISKEEFDLLVAGILSQNVESNNIQNILISKPANNGIWISENSREAFINFLNEHTIYTYSVDSNGYLICDNIMKDNPNLDMYEKMETEVDIEIKNILQKNVLIIVDLNNSYYMYDENNNIVKTQLQNEDYLKSFSFENQRAIILNNEYYSKAEFNLALSDYFVKALDNVQEKVVTGELTFNKQPLTRSDTSKPGNMLSAQTVYAGPSSSNYATVGSVSSGEMVYLLGQQSGWYHIQYMVTGTSQQKSGFVPVSTVNNNGYSVHEEQMTGGQNFATSTVSIMSCDDTSIDLSLGTVYAGEGMTVLYTYTYIDSSKSYDIAYVEISTPSGTKRGYIPTSSLTGINYPSSVARVTDTNSAYSGPDNSFVKLGGAYYNEFVTILAKNTGNNWVWVEYNTPSGRKRGFMDYTKLYNYNHPGMYNDLPVFTALKQATQQLTVYGGPSTNAANIGLIYNQEVVSLLNTERGFAYIEYNTSNGAKRGYVTESALTNSSPPSIPNIPTYANFTSETYGVSGLGEPLKYYKIGNGTNVAFAVFEQHGWEDKWAADGIELVKIADRVMQNLSSTGISSNWTLYIIPYANPDGITDGYTNNGPGRCTVRTKVDMNRCWPANFTPYYTSRNYTGSSPLNAPEAVVLKNFIESNIGNGQKIILDIHGWLNTTYGDSTIASYFVSQFGFSPHYTYGSGYLATWGKSIGASSCLIELPEPSSSQDILNRDFSGKVTNAIINMLNGMGGSTPPTEGGTEVYEEVRVTANGGLNVRSGPGTSYSITASLAQGSVVTRIRKGVASSGGYIWDKIRLSNGTEGYVATNYLEIIGNTGNTLSENDVKIVKAFCKFNNINGYNGEINGTYDDNIFFTIQEFQRINELPKTGYINVNDATWNAMELNNTTIYSLYQQIANNYIQYNNPYGPDTYNVPDSSYGTQFTTKQTEAKIQQEEQWKTEEGQYNSMSEAERVLKSAQMGLTETALVGIAATCSNLFPKASKGITNYLSNTGMEQPLTSIQTLEFIQGSEGRKNLVDTYTNNAKNAVEYMLTIDKVANFSMVNAMPLELSMSELDWFAFLGNYYFSIDGQCYKNGNLYSLVGEYKIQDYYDFDSVKGIVEIANAIGDGRLDDVVESRVADLHYAGRAKFYYVRGSTTLNIQWYK